MELLKRVKLKTLMLWHTYLKHDFPTHVESRTFVSSITKIYRRNSNKSVIEFRWILLNSLEFWGVFWFLIFCTRIHVHAIRNSVILKKLFFEFFYVFWILNICCFIVIEFWISVVNSRIFVFCAKWILNKYVLNSFFNWIPFFFLNSCFFEFAFCLCWILVFVNSCLSLRIHNTFENSVWGIQLFLRIHV